MDAMAVTNAATSRSAAPIGFGCESIDDQLRGGLVRGAMHEFFAARHADSAAATGFALAMTLRAAGQRPVLLVRQDVLESETGCLDAIGLREFGFALERVILVRARDIEGVLRAGEQGARCAPLGAVLMQTWGHAKILDLTASRRLALASAKSGVPVFMLRIGAAATPSAAATRWTIEAGLSRPLAANAPGQASFLAQLVRHRGGVADGKWRMEWNRDRACFEEQKRPGLAPLSRPVAAVPVGRSAEVQGAADGLRRAG